METIKPPRNKSLGNESPKKLAEFQIGFRALIQGSNEAKESDQSDETKKLIQKTLQDIACDSHFSKQARVQIYANAWYQRIFQSLLDDYEVLASSLGEEPFSQLIQDYLKKHPSVSYTLVHVGDYLPDFLKTWRYPSISIGASTSKKSNSHPKSTTYKKPWHADLAFIEREFYLSFYAKDPIPWELSKLTEVSSESMEILQLETEAGVSLLASKWNVGQMWRKERKRVSKVPSFTLIYRHHYQVKVVDLNRFEFKILSRIHDELSQGATLGSLLDLYPSQKTIAVILKWASLGVIRPQI